MKLVMDAFQTQIHEASNIYTLSASELDSNVISAQTQIKQYISKEYTFNNFNIHIGI